MSYLAGKANNQLLIPSIILGGILPDIDFLFLFHPGFNQIHRVFTHNLLFVCFSSLLIGLWATNYPKKWVIFSLLIGGTLHLLADACLDSNPSNGIGIPFFWPFDKTFYSPLNLACQIKHPEGWGEPLRMVKYSFYGLIWELPFYILSILLMYKNFKNS